MAVFRVQKTKDYTVMSNAHLLDARLSLKAKGLLSVMLALPDDWDYSIKGLCRMVKEGVESIMKTLQEIEKAGYLRRTKLTDQNGRFAGYDYDIYETPYSENPNTEKPNTEKPYSGNPYSGNPTQQNNVLNKILIKQNTEKTKNTTTTTTESAGAREEESEVMPPTVSAIYAHFKEQGIEDARNEAEKFEAYNARRGWDCLPDWKPTADLWAARIEDRNRRAS